MNNLLENQYVSTTLAVFLVLYGGLAAPILPLTFVNLFTNPFFRMFIIFLIAYTSSKNHSIALIATIVLVLLMQSSTEEEQLILIDETGNNSKHIHKHRRAHKFMMDEELAKGDNKRTNILKNSVVTEDHLVNAVINSEIDALQSNEVVHEDEEGNLQTEIVNIEEELRKEPEVVQTQEGIPGPVDNNKFSNVELAQEVQETPIEDQIIKTNNIPPNDSNIRSTRGLSTDPSECLTCDTKIQEYKINTNQLILPFSKNGHFNYNNM